MCEIDQNRKPLIHCITNPIAMNQSANAVLAVGGRPMMAEHPFEVAEITETAGALLLNLGNISDSRMEAMKVSIKVANTKGIPVVLDVVGIACSKMRLRFVYELLKEHVVTVIKGNYSEIQALYDSNYRASGVDCADDVGLGEMCACLKSISAKYKAIIVATGKTDVVATDVAVEMVGGGCKQLSEVTGTGCMLGAIIATFLSFKDRYKNEFKMVIKACDYFKQCGKAANMPSCPGSFMVRLLDELGSNTELI